MTLSDKIQKDFPKEIDFPQELKIFCDWIEQYGYESIKTDFALLSYPDSMSPYFENGHKLNKYIHQFGHSGDGGIFAIWQNENKQHIVHLGSEGNNWFIVSDNFTDFLKLLSIGYTDLVYEDLQKPPFESNIQNEFKNWVELTFNVSVPVSAKEITNKTDKSFTKWLFDKLDPEESFEHFDPDSKHNSQFNSIEYRIVVTEIPENKAQFIGDLRKISDMSISGLMSQLKNLPLIVYESSTYFHGELTLENFPAPNKESLLYLTAKYKSEINLEYRDNVRQSDKTDFKKIE